MENLNLRPDQLKGILSLFASGKFQSLLEASGSSLCNGNAFKNYTGTAQDGDSDSSEVAKTLAPGGFPESNGLGGAEINSEEIFLESKDTAQTYTARHTARELLEKAKKGTKATSAQQTFRVSMKMF